MNRLFGNLLALVCLLSVMCLSSCSYIEAENKVKNEINKVSPESTPDSNEVYEESQKAVEDKIEAEIKKRIEEKIPAFSTNEQLHHVGETFISNYGTEECQYEITINGVNEYNSFGDAGVSISDTRLDSDEAKEIYDLNTDSFKNSEKFIVCDVTIKNISVDMPNDEHNAGWISLKDFSYMMVNDAVWFSNHPAEKTIHNYYHYTLPVGETTNFKIGWIYDSNEYSPEDLFLIVGAGTSDNFKEYVYLS